MGSAGAVPLLQARRRFAGSTDFRLYDVVADGGGVIDDVFAYSNGRGDDRSLIVYHNRFGSASGWVRESVPFSVPDEAGGGRTVVKRPLGAGWRLSDADDAFVLLDGKLSRPDGGSAATLIQPLFGLQGVGLVTWNGWGSLASWVPLVLNLEMHGEGTGPSAGSSAARSRSSFTAPSPISQPPAPRRPPARR